MGGFRKEGLIESLGCAAEVLFESGWDELSDSVEEAIERLKHPEYQEQFPIRPAESETDARF